MIEAKVEDSKKLYISSAVTANHKMFNTVKVSLKGNKTNLQLKRIYHIIKVEKKSRHV